MKVNVCPGDDLQKFYPFEAEYGQDVLDDPKLIQTNLTELDVESVS